MLLYKKIVAQDFRYDPRTYSSNQMTVCSGLSVVTNDIFLLQMQICF